MNFLRRLLLFIWSLLIVKIAVIIGVFTFRADIANNWLRDLATLFISGNYHWQLLLIAAGVLILGGLSLFVALVRKSEQPQMVVGSSESGQVNISLAAVDSVVKKACLEITAVHESHTKLKATRDGVAIFLNLTVPHQTNIPETAASLQAVVKQQLESLTGLQVKEVKVLIANVADKPTTQVARLS